MKKILLVIIICTQFSCSKDDDSSIPETIQIRIKNISQFNYSDIQINTGGGENNYGNISASRTSKYGGFDFAYRYALVELKINGEIFTIQPIDYFGEVKLTPGNYTYEIGANDSAERYGKLTLNLVRD
ncbi:hypothetical protein [Aquimarina sp. AU58]|uniref:hypothetical protein n=1 Tax=Aquimarina sp. AU58 TaxID=1874112 RepID=UPI000D6EA797|nr:hypothetical protein [Aquimarina sp. AU58]